MSINDCKTIASPFIFLQVIFLTQVSTVLCATLLFLSTPHFCGLKQTLKQGNPTPLGDHPIFSILFPSSSFLTPYASSSVAACRRGAYGYVPLFSFLIPYASSSVAAYRRGAFGNVPSSLHPLISPFVQGNNPTQSPHSGNGLQ